MIFTQASPQFHPRTGCPSCSQGGMGGGVSSAFMMMNLMLMQMMSMILTQLVGGMSGARNGGGFAPFSMGNPGFGGGGGGLPFGGLGQSTGNFLGASSPMGGFPGSSAGSVPFNSNALSGPIGGGGQPSSAVQWALSQEGVSESGNPDVVRSYSRGRWEAWCAHFVSTAYEKTGGSPWGHQASVAGILSWGRNNPGHFISTAQAKANPGSLKEGDVVVWKQNGRSHVGLLTGVNPDGTFTTIEGNTGDKVARRKHSFNSSQLTGFVRGRGTF